MTIATLLVTTPNIVRNAQGEMIRKRGQSVVELEMPIPAKQVTLHDLRLHTEAEIVLMGLQRSCIQADVFQGNRLLASFSPVRNHNITRG